MTTCVGDLFDFHRQGYWVVVPTNIGWKRDHSNPMGVGVAGLFSRHYPDLASWYGERCRRFRAATAVQLYRPARLLLVPTKPLDPKSPWASWRQPACLSLLERSLRQLAYLGANLPLGIIYLPLLGCGAGGLTETTVLPLLSKYLETEIFRLCLISA